MEDFLNDKLEGANVPVYVLEYLLGMYAATDDEESINEGVERVKNILSDNFVPITGSSYINDFRALAKGSFLFLQQYRLDYII